MLLVIGMRLKLMYEGWTVKVLAVLVIGLIIVLMNGFFAESEDASKLKIGVLFETPTHVTDEILRSLNETDILVATEIAYDEGVRAVKENRLQGLFVFKSDFEERINEGAYEELVELYFLDENYVPYLLTDIVGSKLIGEIALATSRTFIKDAFEAIGYTPEDGFYELLYQEGKKSLEVEKDNFFVEKKLITRNNEEIDYVALNNVLLYKQILLGVLYVFVAFYMMFLVVNRVRDHEVGIATRWHLSKLSQLDIVLGEYVSVVVGAMPLMMVVSLFQWSYEGHLIYFMMVNLLYTIAYSGLLFFLGEVLNKVTVYVLVTTGVVMLLGVISGSFFALNTDTTLVRGLSYLVPTYHLLQELVQLDLKDGASIGVEYGSYMLIFGLTSWVVTYGITIKRRYYK